MAVFGARDNIPVLEISGVSKAFAATRALTDVDFWIRPGERVAVMGENGAGKSTLMKVIAGVHVPDAGEMRLNGEPYAPKSPTDAIKAGVATVYQEPAGFGHLSVLENVFIGRQKTNRLGMLDTKTMRADGIALLDSLNLSPSLLRKTMGQLSLAEQQQVLIARAVSNEARILILDEPTSILTNAEASNLFALVDRLSATGTAICYITHRFDELERTAERFVVLKDGKNAGELPTPDREHLLRMMGSIASEPAAPKTATSGSESSRTRRQAGDESSSGPVVLGLDRLSSGNLFRNISFSIREGQIVGLYGLVGAGRTELALAVLGELPLDSGQIVYQGDSFTPRSSRRSVEQGIAYLPEDRGSQGVFKFMTVGENLISAALPIVSRWGVVSRNKEREVVKQWIDRLAIKSSGPRAPIASLSGGNQQKVLLARLMATHPKLLLLDEPTRGIDVATKQEIHRDIRELARSGVAILLISSELAELLELAAEVHVLHEGRLSASMSGDEITEEAVLRAAVGVEA